MVRAILIANHPKTQLYEVWIESAQCLSRRCHLNPLHDFNYTRAGAPLNNPRALCQERKNGCQLAIAPRPWNKNIDQEVHSAKTEKRRRNEGPRT